QFDKVRQLTADERRVHGVTISLNGVAAFAAVVPDHHVFVIAKMSVIPVFHPLLLHKLKLPEEAGVERHKDDAVLVFVIDRLGFWNIRPIGHAAPGDSPAINQLAVKSKGITRIGAADMRADGTTRAIAILAEGEIHIAALVL